MKPCLYLNQKMTKHTILVDHFSLELRWGFFVLLPVIDSNKVFNIMYFFIVLFIYLINLFV